MVLALEKLQRLQEYTDILADTAPITFEQYLHMFGEDDDYELIDGVAVERMSAQIDHERLFAWLLTLFTMYTEQNRLGIVLGSRAAVRISDFRGRLPDLLFVRSERMHIVQQKAIYGAPDLVLEIVSPGERRSDIIQREADYRTVGVREIWLMDRPRGRVRVVRKGDEHYEEQEFGEGEIESVVLPGLRLQVQWLLGDERPPVHEVLKEVSG
ncbi:MAG: Uma2 family endonuclease [Armatimonadota bacterium]